MITVLDVILIFCTGGLWLFVIFARTANARKKESKYATKYYKRRRYHD